MTLGSSQGRALALAWAPALAYMALIWIVSDLSSDEVPAIGAFVYDKIAHFGEYLVLGVLLAHAAIRTWPDRSPGRTFAFAVLATAAWGALDEMHQAFVPGRSAELLDLAADAAGACLGAALRHVPRLLRPRTT